jgi:hypothetical protein
MSEIDYAARVQRGIALMDIKWPNWATEIDLERLDIQNDSHCVTAQYAKSRGRAPWFTNGQNLLDLDDRSYELHGFDLDDVRESARSEEVAYVTLNGLWKAEIIRRREAARPEANEGR